MKQEVYENEWWNAEGGDQSMEDEHSDFWNMFLSEVREDVAGKQILDFGCNQGGMLRLLYDTRGIRSGVGVDLSKHAIAVANQRKGDRPLEYQATADLSAYASSFDIALSSSVIYLVADLADHAAQLFASLKPGGVYYANHPDYVNYRNAAQIWEEIDSNAAVPCQRHTLDAIGTAFAEAGFRVGVKRMQPTGFVHYSPDSRWYPTVPDLMDARYVHAHLFRFERPGS